MVNLCLTYIVVVHAWNAVAWTVRYRHTENFSPTKKLATDSVES